LFSRKKPTKREEGQRPSNIASDKGHQAETANNRKSRLQSWLGESATPGED
jgi:hypothetical protein